MDRAPSEAANPTQFEYFQEFEDDRLNTGGKLLLEKCLIVGKTPEQLKQWIENWAEKEKIAG